jgi:hypothetical protein
MLNGPFDPVWSHIDSCPHCDRDLRRLCKVGRERLATATDAAAERIFYVPNGPTGRA